MAIFEYTSLLSRIRGKINAGVFQQWKGRNFSRSTARPRQTRSYDQQFVKYIYSKLSTDWQALSSGSQTAWNTYGELYTPDISGFNSYIRNNTILIFARNANLTQTSIAPYGVWSPPITYIQWTQSQPLSQRILAYVYKVGMLTHCHQVQYSWVPGFRDDSSPMWKFLITLDFANSNAYLYVSAYPQGTIFRFRVRNINTFGHASAWSAVKEHIKDF